MIIRCARKVVLILMLLVGFFMQSEIFQKECWNFSSAYFFNFSIDELPISTRSSFVHDVNAFSEEYSVSPFAIKIKMQGKHRTNLEIFGSKKTFKVIESKTHIHSGKFCSPVSGETNVFYRNFQASFADMNNISEICLCGEKEKIRDFYEFLAKKYSIGTLSHGGSTEKDMITFVWGFIGAALFILVLVEIIFDRKEVLIREVLGDGLYAMILKKILIEISSDLLIFFLVKTIFRCFYQGSFAEERIFLIYLISLLFSSALYFIFALFDPREVFAGATISKGMSVMIAGGHFILTAILFFSFGMNAWTVQSNITSWDRKNLANVYGNDYLIHIRQLANTEAGEKAYVQRMYDFYFKHYQSYKPVQCVKALETQSTSWIYCNQYGKSFISDFTSNASWDSHKDVTVFLPEEWKNGKKQSSVLREVKEDTEFVLKMNLYEMRKLNIEYIWYSQNRTASYVSLSEENSPGISKEKNPVVVYCHTDKSMHVADSNYFPINLDNIFFAVSEGELTEYQKTAGDLEISWTRVSEEYQFRNQLLWRLVSFFGIFCSFNFLSCLFFTALFVRTEYRMHAMEYALKKVLGYLYLEMNLGILICTCVPSVICGTAMILYAYLVREESLIRVSEGLTFIFLLVELLFIRFEVHRLERTSVKKILKGGAL